jgi:predicted patatin/cPLA2 family phospholipase
LVCEKNAIFSPKIGGNCRKLRLKHRTVGRIIVKKFTADRCFLSPATFVKTTQTFMYYFIGNQEWQNDCKSDIGNLIVKKIGKKNVHTSFWQTDYKFYYLRDWKPDCK